MSSQRWTWNDKGCVRGLSRGDYLYDYNASRWFNRLLLGSPAVCQHVIHSDTSRSLVNSSDVLD